jgi:hypothetical protein
MTFLDTGNICRFTAVSAGVVDFIVASAPAGKLTPEQAYVIDVKIYSYYAQSPDGSMWEMGSGSYLIATHKLVRTTIKGTSNNDQNIVNFIIPPIVDVYPSPLPSLELKPPDGAAAFPSGTLMLFQQSTAPTFWTKQTTHNDKALRVVSGSASSGGSNAFSTVMAQTTAGNHTIPIGEMPSHPHSDNESNNSNVLVIGCGTIAVNSGTFANNTGAVGGGGAHNHTILMSIQYVDLIIAMKA